MNVTSGSQDPALIEDSPAIKAAVAEERRFNSMEGAIRELTTTVNQTLAAVQGVNSRLDTQNGRVGKTEKAIEDVKGALTLAENRMKDRRLWERLDIIEKWKGDQVVDSARDEGVNEGKVALRTSDKFWFGTFVTIGLALLGAVIKFL